MRNNYSEELVSSIVQRYEKGEAVAFLCKEYEVPRSTVYYWISHHKALKSRDGTEVTYRDYYNLKRKCDKLAEKLAVVKAADCNFSAPLQEKLIALENLYGKYSVHVLCEALEVSRGTFYNHIFRRKTITQYDIQKENIREQVEIIFNGSKQRFGAKKIHAIMTQQGVKTSPGYIAELMREMGLETIGRNSKKEYRKQLARSKRVNKVQREFNVSAPNKVWVSDITYFSVKGKSYYICIVMDLFSRKIVAYRASRKQSTYLATSTLRIALEERGNPKGLTFHSDQGAQYTSRTFRELLRLNNIVQSFSAAGSPYDNAVAEAFFGTLKKEELYRRNYKSEREFCDNLDDFMEFYNTERPHGTLGYKTPEKYENEYFEKLKKDNK